MKEISNELYEEMSSEEMENLNGGSKLLDWLNQLGDTIELCMGYYC